MSEIIYLAEETIDYGGVSHISVHKTIEGAKAELERVAGMFDSTPITVNWKKSIVPKIELEGRVDKYKDICYIIEQTEMKE